ncbi:hypothetical protein [Microvirga puerhi]|uniref:Uncharacterized protein n=1 Tax=Microvirga puerhi TaxID=2876078 RepID=A0ABS7VTN3_9HYPH|nr:hypothetical protein [Microvirga puerhi]MBZ6078928.1 hypothetical protein [Microvirga puerhi]
MTIRYLAILATTAAMVFIAMVGEGAAQSSQQSSGCSIQQASDAALQQQIALIDAAKVNVPEFFTGANSCINPNLFKSFDLSSLIPDAAGFLQGGLAGTAENLLNQAKTQLCGVLNEQMNKLLGRLRSTITDFSSSIGSELSSILGGSTGGLQLPNIPNVGQYDFSRISEVPSNGGQTTNQTPVEQTPPSSQFTIQGQTKQTPTATSVAPKSGSGFADSIFGTR